MGGFLTGMEVSASGLSAQRVRMNVVASNLANSRTTQTAEGGPYRRRDPVFESVPVSDFRNDLDEAVRGVQVVGIQEDPRPFMTVWDPGHPDANPEGYLELPNVNIMEEMVNMVMASRSYEANATAFETLKRMAMRALQIG